MAEIRKSKRSYWPGASKKEMRIQKPTMIWLAIALLFVYLFTTKPPEIETSSSSTSTNSNTLDTSQACSMNFTGSTLKNTWTQIDATLDSEYAKDPISGGIFLSPLQSSLMTWLVRTGAEYTTQHEHRPVVVCETGFGSGHSSALFLDATPDITLHTFDLFNRPYQIPILEQLKTIYSNRHITHYADNSCITVPQALQANDNPIQCDILHGSSLCPTDNLDLVEQSPCGVILTSTMMPSVRDPSVYFGPKAQWTQLRARDCIQNITCFREDEHVMDRNYKFARKGTRITARFCMAVTTGKCQKGGIVPSSTTSSGCGQEGFSVFSNLLASKLPGLCQDSQILSF